MSRELVEGKLIALLESYCCGISDIQCIPSAIDEATLKRPSFQCIQTQDDLISGPTTSTVELQKRIILRRSILKIPKGGIPTVRYKNVVD